MQDSTSEVRAGARPEPAQYVEAEHGIGQGANQPDCAADLHEPGMIRDAARNHGSERQRMATGVHAQGRAPQAIHREDLPRP